MIKKRPLDKQINIRLSGSLRDALNKKAAECDATVGELIRALIIREITRKEYQQPKEIDNE